MAGREVVDDQLPLPEQRLIQINSRRVRPERRAEILVLEIDDQHTLDAFGERPRTVMVATLSDIPL